MTVFYYIMVAVFFALSLVGAVVVVFRAGEKELICKYERGSKK